MCALREGEVRHSQREEGEKDLKTIGKVTARIVTGTTRHRDRAWAKRGQKEGNNTSNECQPLKRAWCTHPNEPEMKKGGGRGSFLFRVKARQGKN